MNIRAQKPASIAAMNVFLRKLEARGPEYQTVAESIKQRGDFYRIKKKRRKR